LPTGGFIEPLAFSPAGRTVASGQGDATVLVWDVMPGLRQVGLPAKTLPPDDLERLWADLRGDAAAKAHTAVWTLIAAPTDAVTLLKNRLKPVKVGEARRVQQLLLDLDSEEFAVREKASEQLKKLDSKIDPSLCLALRGALSAEARQRLEAVLAGRTGRFAFPAETVRTIRAIQVLEQIGSLEAVGILKTLSTGIGTAPETQEAKESLQRLAKKPAFTP
jgi:hypothetical protein